MGKRVAVVIAERALGGRTNVSEDKGGGGLGGDSLQVDTVPGWDYRGEYAWFWTKFRVGVVSYSKAIA